MIELATLRATSPLERISQNNVNPVWLTSIEAESGQYRAYVKHINIHAIYTEAVCAIAGRELGLDIPKPFIVVANHPAIADEYTYLFGCEDVGFESFKQHVEAGDEAVEIALITWCKFHDIVIFDEWIANGDRNQGNFLYNNDGSFTLIDHDHAFGGEPWHENGLSRTQSNELYKITHALGDLEKKKLRDVATVSLPIYNNIDTKQICNHQHFETLLQRQNKQDVLEFLNQNSQDLSNMIKERTGVQVLL